MEGMRRQTRRHFSAEYKNRSVLNGLCVEDSSAALCRTESIAQARHCTRSKQLLEAGYGHRAGD